MPSIILHLILSFDVGQMRYYMPCGCGCGCGENTGGNKRKQKKTIRGRVWKKKQEGFKLISHLCQHSQDRSLSTKEDSSVGMTYFSLNWLGASWGEDQTHANSLLPFPRDAEGTTVGGRPNSCFR
jgi:hypothetical protein